MYHFNFQTQANFDEVQYVPLHDHKSLHLPTTTHNSPGSEKSSCGSLEFQDSNNSFEAGTQLNHATNIWNGSLNLLNNTTNILQDQMCFNRYGVTSISEKTLEEMIKDNSLLRLRDKSKLMKSLQSESQLCSLLVELMLIFNQTIFHQLVYIVQNIWEHKYLNFRTKHKNEVQQFLPSFKGFYGFQGKQQEANSIFMYEQKSASEIKAAAIEGIQELANQLFFSKKLRYLNLSNINQKKVEKTSLREQFTKFVKCISKAVFLSAEGIYEEEKYIPIFSEEEQEECNMFDLEIEEPNRFIRTFSQIQQEDEFKEFDSSSKRRKY